MSLTRSKNAARSPRFGRPTWRYSSNAGLPPSTASCSIDTFAISAEPGRVQHLPQHDRRFEVLLGDRPGGPRMPLVVRVELRQRGEHVVLIAKREQALAGRKPVAETRVLMEDRPSGGQIARATVAEPAAARDHVGVLGDAEVGIRAGDERLVDVD